MNYISQVPSSPPTIYLDFPPSLLSASAYVLLTIFFHAVCLGITKITYD